MCAPLLIARDFCGLVTPIESAVKCCLSELPTYGGKIVSNSTKPVLKQTPLFEEHLKLGAKMIDFGGWSMPVFYSSIIEEHQAVRQHVGIFDISHMGQIRGVGTICRALVEYGVHQ